MHTIWARNVNSALPVAVTMFRSGSRQIMRTNPRGMPTLEWDTPVTTIYQRPLERVLFSATRDANPFFHLFEAMWILAGREDVGFLSHLLPRIADYSDDGERFHGAYGHRLRVLHEDQLSRVVQMLHNDYTTRRAVCSIWDTKLDLPHGATNIEFNELHSKDIPCNDLLAFRVRNNRLDLTVYNRSNDVIWGAYGANAVQFAFILEYVSLRTGIPVGRYYQVSNSFHIYLNEQWEQLKADQTLLLAGDPYEATIATYPDLGFERVVMPLQLFPGVHEDPEGWDAFEDDLTQMFMRWDEHRTIYGAHYHTQWFKHVLVPAWNVLEQYRLVRGVPAQIRPLIDYAVDAILAPDWALAIAQWIQRRAEP